MSKADRSRLPYPSYIPAFDLPEVVKHSLENGLRLWTVEHRNVPLVTALLLLPVGSASDPVIRPGLAAATADLLDEGAGGLSGLELNDEVDRIGGRLGIGVNSDITVISLLMLTRFKERGLSILSDLVTRPHLLAEDFERVRQLRLNRLTQLGQDPSAIADRVFMSLAYDEGHPYGHQPIGTEESLKELKLAELASFFRMAYKPNGATLIVVGDASHDDLVRVVQETFSDWQSEDHLTSDAFIRDPDDTLALPSASRRLAIVHRKSSAQSVLRIGLPAASRKTPDYHSMQVFNMVLGGQFTSRIMLNLREEKGYTYGASTSFDFRRGMGPFVMGTSVKTSVTVDAIREVLSEFQKICEEYPVTEAELTVAKASLTNGYPRKFQTAEQVASALGELAVYGLSENELMEFPLRVSRVDVDGVTRVARKYLDVDRLLTVIVGDRDVVEPLIDSLTFGTKVDVVC